MGKKILLTGAAGCLASALYPCLEKQGWQVVLTGLPKEPPHNPVLHPMDICDAAQVLKTIELHRPDWVFHLAAATDVDRCEVEPDYAFRVNTLGTENIVLACKKFGAGLVYLSTGVVFGGEKKDPYTEFDAPNPVSVYGRSKLEGEKIVQAFLDRYYIFRAGWMIGGGKKDKKFVAKILRLMETEKEIKVVNDKFGSPTFIDDMSEHMAKILLLERYGLYHLCNLGPASRYQIALKMVEILGRKDVKIIPVSSSEFLLPAPRAASELMVNYRLNLLGLNSMPHWETSLKNYLFSQKKTI